jgi:hypothetical protein
MDLSLRLLPLVCLTIALAAMPAWADGQAEVLAANRAFDAVVSSRDINALDPLWPPGFTSCCLMASAPADRATTCPSG